MSGTVNGKPNLERVLQGKGRGVAGAVGAVPYP